MQENQPPPVSLDVSVNEEQLKAIFKQQVDYFNSGATRPLKFRIHALKQLRAAIQQHEAEIEKALFHDLRKSSFEAFGTEVGIILKEIDFTIDLVKEAVNKLREMSPLWEMFKEGIDLKSIQWSEH